MNKKQINLIVLIVAGVAIGGVFGFFSVKNKNIGPYEYVRKARKNVDAGKYKKAIYLLHKAYEELPESEDIKNNLLYGYARYADALEEKGDIDQAIEYLEMAHEMGESDQVVVNNLAIFYCKKGVQLAETKKYNLAMEYLNKAEESAMVSKKIRKNVANYLFNAAVRAYNKNDGRTVFICLNVSYVLRVRFDTLFMLGQQFYKESDLERAKFYWEKAFSLRPSDVNIKENLEKLDKEIQYKEQLREIRTEHFDIQLHRKYNVDEVVLKDVLNNVYNRVGKDLRYYPSADTPIIFYNELDFRDIFKQEGIVRGFFDGGSIRLIFITDLDNPLFPALIAHEYTHAVISIVTKNKCPIWLNEGLAVFEQSRYMEPSYQHVRVALDKGAQLSIAQLEQGFETLDDVFMTGLSYEGAHTAVLFILDKWGWVGLRDLIEKIKDGQHFANAIDEEFYISVNVFEKMWNEYLRNKFK
jgi:tetratricopeptide (TPR) repeat protein